MNETMIYENICIPTSINFRSFNFSIIIIGNFKASKLIYLFSLFIKEIKDGPKTGANSDFV